MKFNLLFSGLFASVLTLTSFNEAFATNVDYRVIPMPQKIEVVFPADSVKKFIDMLALHNINRFQGYHVIKNINHEVFKDDKVTFKNFSWRGKMKARFVRYQAERGKFGGFIFTDEILIK